MLFESEKYHRRQISISAFLQNTKKKRNTIIKDELGNTTTADLTKLKFLPNYMIDEIADITIDDNEEGIEVIYSRTFYGTDKKNS